MFWDFYLFLFFCSVSINKTPINGALVFLLVRIFGPCFCQSGCAILFGWEAYALSQLFDFVPYTLGHGDPELPGFRTIPEQLWISLFNKLLPCRPLVAKDLVNICWLTNHYPDLVSDAW